jgi:hypothetical protein
MTIQELINKSILKPDPVRDNMDGTYTIKVKRIAKITTSPEKQRPFQVVKYFITTCDVCSESCPKRLTKKQMFQQKTYCNLICHGIMQKKMNKRTIYEDGWRIKKAYYGYVVKRIWNDRHKGEWVTQHRYNMEQYLGRKLLRTEIVHHIDMDKTNNNINNLWLCNHSTHTTAHGSMNIAVAGLIEKGLVEFNEGKYYLKEK